MLAQCTNYRPLPYFDQPYLSKFDHVAYRSLQKCEDMRGAWQPIHHRRSCGKPGKRPSKPPASKRKPTTSITNLLSLPKHYNCGKICPCLVYQTCTMTTNLLAISHYLAHHAIKKSYTATQTCRLASHHLIKECPAFFLVGRGPKGSHKTKAGH